MQSIPEKGIEPPDSQLDLDCGQKSIGINPARSHKKKIIYHWKCRILKDVFLSYI